MSRGRPVTPVGRVIRDFIRAGLDNSGVAQRVVQHFHGQMVFDVKKLTQRIANTRFAMKRVDHAGFSIDNSDGATDGGHSPA